jgi:hypothetical protein
MALEVGWGIASAKCSAVLKRKNWSSISCSLGNRHKTIGENFLIAKLGNDGFVRYTIDRRESRQRSFGHL